jgi:hypothetical protein
MRKIYILIAVLICTATIAPALTACSSGSDDSNEETADSNNGSDNEEQNHNIQRAIFQEHMATNLKMLAENLNLAPWKAANIVNSNFNTTLLSNTKLKESFQQYLQQELTQTLQPASEELTALGYKYQGNVDLTALLNLFTQQCEDPVISFFPPQGQTEAAPVLASYLSSDTVAVIMQVPRQLQFTISSVLTGETAELFKGTLQFTFNPHGLKANPMIDTWTINGSVQATIPSTIGNIDAATLSFTISQDGINKKSTNQMVFEHNGKKMIELEATNTQENGLSIFPEFANDTSLLELIYFFASGKKIDDMKLTLLDDMTINLAITDCAAAVRIWQEEKTARRAYAPVTTIDIFTQELNQLITATITCKNIKQQLPVKLVTARIGVDHLAMPALKFTDEDYYAPLTELIDINTMGYAINIVDHCLDPAQETVICIRQFMQFMKTLLNNNEKQE